MVNYLFINLSIAALILMIIRFGRGTNWSNYHLSNFGIFLWFIPYSYLSEIAPTETIIMPIVASFSQTTISHNVISPSFNSDVFDDWIHLIFLSFMSIGILLFIIKLAMHLKWKKELLSCPTLTYQKEFSSKYNVPIFTSDNIATGILLGFCNPKILISKTVTEANLVELIITHEKTHLVHQDNVKLLVLSLIESLFWWNPIVRKLVNINKFYIEAICDEKACIAYGKDQYIEDLVALMLRQHDFKGRNLVSSATSNKQNNLGRIKQLKEPSFMTFRKKLTYIFAALVAVTTMTWNTFALALHEGVKVDKSEPDLLIDVDVQLIDRSDVDVESQRQTQVRFLIDFDKESRFEISDKFKFDFMVKEKEESAFIDIELIEFKENKEVVVANPKLLVAFAQEAQVEIDNPEVSKHGYYIKLTVQRKDNIKTNN